MEEIQSQKRILFKEEAEWWLDGKMKKKLTKSMRVREIGQERDKEREKREPEKQRRREKEKA